MTPNTAGRQLLGRVGEDAAAHYLIAHGFRILDRNWRCRHGEIDVVAAGPDVIVFAEVKTRSGLGYGHPFEAITQRKLDRMRLLAGVWCAQHETHSARIRLDAIGVLARPGQPATIEHLAGVG